MIALQTTDHEIIEDRIEFERSRLQVAEDFSKLVTEYDTNGDDISAEMVCRAINFVLMSMDMHDFEKPAVSSMPHVACGSIQDPYQTY